jgi:hypothetical protein
MTPTQFQNMIQDLEIAADIALPLAGHAELVPIANAAASLIVKIAAVAAAARGDAVVDATMNSARLAADVAEALRFPSHA